MAQFDVYRNPSKQSKEAYPYLVDMQNSVIDQLATRLIVPLSIARSKPTMLMKNLMPEILFEGERYFFLTQQLTSMPAENLKSPIGTLESSRSLLIDAIDFAITGI
ncbi:CcdB family protein [Alteromonas oceanisediminis]|uniref:CcdB family protein n=1 Tax=Alteromonas oceanisediminis TaxID=2836180 RepID=UPI001BD961B2|nr:CcdB family protein [Alteromonas oceanisediminis]MBT0588109.1 CcdB family protein [Alteromonas oceanisediminis]